MAANISVSANNRVEELSNGGLVCSDNCQGRSGQADRRHDENMDVNVETSDVSDTTRSAVAASDVHMETGPSAQETHPVAMERPPSGSTVSVDADAEATVAGGNAAPRLWEACSDEETGEKAGKAAFLSLNVLRPGRRHGAFRAWGEAARAGGEQRETGEAAETALPLEGIATTPSGIIHIAPIPSTPAESGCTLPPSNRKDKPGQKRSSSHLSSAEQEQLQRAKRSPSPQPSTSHGAAVARSPHRSGSSVHRALHAFMHRHHRPPGGATTAVVPYHLPAAVESSDSDADSEVDVLGSPTVRDKQDDGSRRDALRDEATGTSSHAQRRMLNERLQDQVETWFVLGERDQPEERQRVRERERARVYAKYVHGEEPAESPGYSSRRRQRTAAAPGEDRHTWYSPFWRPPIYSTPPPAHSHIPTHRQWDQVANSAEVPSYHCVRNHNSDRREVSATATTCNSTSNIVESAFSRADRERAEQNRATLRTILPDPYSPPWTEPPVSDDVTSISANADLENMIGVTSSSSQSFSRPDMWCSRAAPEHGDTPHGRSPQLEVGLDELMDRWTARSVEQLTAAAERELQASTTASDCDSTAVNLSVKESNSDDSDIEVVSVVERKKPRLRGEGGPRAATVLVDLTESDTEDVEVTRPPASAAQSRHRDIDRDLIPEGLDFVVIAPDETPDSPAVTADSAIHATVSLEPCSVASRGDGTDSGGPSATQSRPMLPLEEALASVETDTATHTVGSECGGLALGSRSTGSRPPFHRLPPPPPYEDYVRNVRREEMGLGHLGDGVRRDGARRRELPPHAHARCPTHPHVAIGGGGGGGFELSRDAPEHRTRRRHHASCSRRESSRVFQSCACMPTVEFLAFLFAKFAFDLQLC